MRLLAVAGTLLLAACSAPSLHVAASPAPSPAPATMEAFLPVAERFVSDHRGLKWKAPVKVTFLDDADFVKKLQETNPVDAAGYATESRVLHALALVEGHPDLAKAEQELEGSDVVGFYDPPSKQLYVRGTDARASVRHVLVHELTHALQDQWFDINRDTNPNDESDIAYRTLVEGDAVRIEDEYIAGLSAADQRQVQQDEQSGPALPADVPDVLQELDSFPYVVGPRFTREVVSAGGQSRLDAAFKSPPVSTAQVLHSQLFLQGRQPASVPEPQAGGKQIDQGVLGELGLDLLLERLTAAGDVTQAQAGAVATGWAGDRYVAWDEGGQTCVSDRLLMQDPASTRALLSALRAFAGEHPGATVEGSGPVLFTACA